MVIKYIKNYCGLLKKNTVYTSNSIKISFKKMKSNYFIFLTSWKHENIILFLIFFFHKFVDLYGTSIMVGFHNSHRKISTR